MRKAKTRTEIWSHRPETEAIVTDPNRLLVWGKAMESPLPSRRPRWDFRLLEKDGELSSTCWAAKATSSFLEILISQTVGMEAGGCQLPRLSLAKPRACWLRVTGCLSQQTQVLVLTRQALYQMSHLLAPHTINLNSVRVSESYRHIHFSR